MTEYEIQPLAWVVKLKGSTVDSESSTTITRTHDGAGQFVEVTQFDGNIRVTLEEWPSIKQAIETAFSEILADELHELKETTPEPEPTGAGLIGKMCWVRNDEEGWKGPYLVDNYDGCDANLPYLTSECCWWKYTKLYREGVEP